MESEIKRYDMYKSGKYLIESNQNELDYWKSFDQIEDEDVKLELLRIQDKINKRNDINTTIVIAVMMIFGAVLGFMTGYSYAIAEGIIEVIRSLV